MNNTDTTGILPDLFRARFGVEPESVSPLPQSGSHRRYYRLSGGGISAIGVDGTDPEENMTFCSLASFFRGNGVAVPEIYAVSPDSMHYLQEDLGQVSLFDFISEGRRLGVYSPVERNILMETVAGLPEIQYKGAQWLKSAGNHRKFDGRMVMFDLEYFKYCFLKTSGVNFDELRLQTDFERLRDEVAAVPANTFMYRDFQSRNVMIRDGRPYYIDFQGGMEGPVYYDLASFVWQARAAYPEEMKKDLIRTYLDALGEYCSPDPVDFYEKLRLFVLLRTLQVLGAYGFRGYFEKKEHFLKSIPAAIRNLRELLSAPFDAFPYLGEVLGHLVEAFDRGDIVYEQEDATERKVSGLSENGKALTVTIYSFSYKKGIPEDASGNGGGYVFDCRYIHNPGKYVQYKSLTGMDAPVIKFLEDDGEVSGFMGNVYSLVDAHVSRFLDRGFTHLMVCFGCTGGQHRSVYCAQSLAGHLAGRPEVKVELIHREQGVYKSF